MKSPTLNRFPPTMLDQVGVTFHGSPTGMTLGDVARLFPNCPVRYITNAISNGSMTITSRPWAGGVA